MQQPNQDCAVSAVCYHLLMQPELKRKENKYQEKTAHPQCLASPTIPRSDPDQLSQLDMMIGPSHVTGKPDILSRSRMCLRVCGGVMRSCERTAYLCSFIHGTKVPQCESFCMTPCLVSWSGGAISAGPSFAQLGKSAFAIGSAAVSERDRDRLHWERV
ncbi:hypothetical protein MCOR07_011855 [Pyricularia oryzae]|uniref:Uncharacterized protein n=1 Tax=Pyricularia grisea TaxID=148305 RepID=A0ABQ8NFJ8_PYRGI|nr:hypothetical protein MCOR33_011783 [Pyricularia grisea]KAI6331161.1 hypothetical protein MCOR28_011839 [Pyricularia oryzae]KAI6361485.1 hypothetical protein MCOR31_012114 [Pyricularia oryzae]KAI6389759.1 hypothetical protein MCOR23_011821 [Pyricularia oryzae]KAI6449074.1 hypothetical protein MCOR17_011981 [Pyricularia oryzae]